MGIVQPGLQRERRKGAVAPQKGDLRGSNSLRLRFVSHYLPAKKPRRVAGSRGTCLRSA